MDGVDPSKECCANMQQGLKPHQEQFSWLASDEANIRSLSGYSLSSCETALSVRSESENKLPSKQ